MKVKVFNQEAKEVATVDLLDAVFGLKWNEALVQQVVNAARANQRQPSAHAKDRAQVRGGGRKPWRQKGTGRARHGSIRSPIWKGGGVTHGPKKERNYKQKINKKMAKKAFFTVLSAKARDQEIVVMDEIKFPSPKTKLADKFFKKLSEHKGLQRIIKGNGVLVALPGKNKETERALRNLPYVAVEEARNLNALKVMQYKYVMFPKDVLDSLSKSK